MNEFLSDDTFAFIIHPITIRKDVNRKFPHEYGGCGR